MRMDMEKLKVTFCNFMKLPKNIAARTIYWWNLKVAHKQKNISTTV